MVLGEGTLPLPSLPPRGLGLSARFGVEARVSAFKVRGVAALAAAARFGVEARVSGFKVRGVAALAAGKSQGWLQRRHLPPSHPKPFINPVPPPPPSHTP